MSSVAMGGRRLVRMIRPSHTSHDSRYSSQVKLDMASTSGYLKKIGLPVCGLIVYATGICMDIALATKYKNEGEEKLFYLTAAFLCISAFIIMCMDVSWYYIDARRSWSYIGVSTWSDLYGFLWWMRVVLSIISLGTLGVVCRTSQYIYYWVKSELASTSESDKCGLHGKALFLQRDCCMFSMTEAFVKTAPHLALQLYIAYHKPFSYIRLLSMILSAASITWNYSAYYRSNMRCRGNRYVVELKPFLFHLLSTFCCIVPRFVSVVLFLVFFEAFGMIVVGASFVIHVLIIFCWIAYAAPALEDTAVSTPLRVPYYILFSYIQFFLFLNVYNDKSRIFKWILYGLIHVENAVLAGLLAFWRLPNLGRREDGWILLSVPISCIFHALFSKLFYCMLSKKQSNNVSKKQSDDDSSNLLDSIPEIADTDVVT